jgi:hypothetical protein
MLLISSSHTTIFNWKAAISPQDPIWWMTHTPKYYFPKLNDYGDFGATSFVLLVATLGIILHRLLQFLFSNDILTFN